MNRLEGFTQLITNHHHQASDTDVAESLFRILMTRDQDLITAAFELIRTRREDLAKDLLEVTAGFTCAQGATLPRVSFLAAGHEMLQMALAALMTRLKDHEEGAVCQALVTVVTPDQLLTGEALFNAMETVFPDDVHGGIHLEELTRLVRLKAEEEAAIDEAAQDPELGDPED